MGFFTCGEGVKLNLRERTIGTTVKRNKRVTATDVAEAAGVSRSAVSRAFTPNAYLDAEKRSHIMSTALRLGYRPNALAASLQGKRSNLVAVAAGGMNNLYNAEFTAMLVARLNAAGKWPIVIGGSEAVLEEAILPVLSYPLDALIVRGSSLSKQVFEDCAKLNIPLIFSGRIIEAPFADCVSCRNADGTAQATRQLIAKGRRHFGFIGGPEGLSSSNDRLTGIRQALSEAGLALTALAQSDYTYEGGRDVAGKLLSDHHIDALLCANDATALGALSVARYGLHRQVPQDLSIVGFDDIAQASWPEYDLTTLRNPLDQTIEEILRLLQERLTDPSKPNEQVYIDPQLVQRGTG